MDLPPQALPSSATIRAHGKQHSLHLANGALRRPRQLPPTTIAYGRCLKNHAANNGGHVLDGCGDYMPLPSPASLECAVCGCHRNFHHIEGDHANQPTPHVIKCQCNHQQKNRHPPPTPPPSCLATMPKSSSTPESQSPPPISSSYYPAAPHMLLTLNSDFPPPEQANNHPLILSPAVATGSNSKGKKRFRSKFSEYQKEKMKEFAEKINWKILKTEEEKIVGFCKQIGVTKCVFKVWMHNHKTNNNPGNKRNNHQNHRDHTNNVVGVNGSSSSF